MVNLVPSGSIRTDALLLDGIAGRGTLASIGIRGDNTVLGDAEAWLNELTFDPEADIEDGE